MGFIALVAVAALIGEPKARLVLELIRTVDDPRVYDLRDQLKGDRSAPKSCVLPDKTSVRLENGRESTIELDRDGVHRSIEIKNTGGQARSTLVCGAGDDFYYVNPRLGDVYAYSAERLWRGADPIVWRRHLDPFRSLDDVDHILTDASVATAIQLRERVVLVEWFFRKDNTTGFWHEAFDRATGAELDKLGPSDLLLKLNEHDPGWIVFQGGGNDVINYVPTALYRLRYAPDSDGVASAGQTITALRPLVDPAPAKSIAKLSANPLLKHMIAMLSPTRTSPNSRIEFCPTVPGVRARYWLGADYNDVLADAARNILLMYWAEHQADDRAESPLDDWFQAEVAPKEPMKTLLARFDPQSDLWIAGYQRALFEIAGPTLEGWSRKYGAASGIIRTPDPTVKP